MDSDQKGLAPNLDYQHQQRGIYPHIHRYADKHLAAAMAFPANVKGLWLT